MGLLLLLCAVAFGQDFENMFSDWSKKHDKVYDTTEETFRRYHIQN